MRANAARLAFQVGQSRLLRRMCNEQRLMRGFNSLNHMTQWRLYSLSLWEQASSVTV